MWTRPIWSGLLKWRLAKGKSIWAQLRSDAEYSWLNLGWSVKTQPKTPKEPINEMVRQNPRQLITLLNWNRRWSEWKSKILRRASIVFLLYCVWLLKRNGMKSISRGWRIEWNCLEKKQCECDYQFFIWFWSVWNGKMIGSRIMWVWMLNSCILHWKSYNKQTRKEGRMC